MKNQLFLGLLLLSTMLTGCKKDEIKPSSKDYIIFGHFYGECQGEKCIEIFKLDHNQLSEDTKDLYPNSSELYYGSYVLLSQQQFNGVKHLLESFPRTLWNDNNKIIGQPDAGDWGGLYIELKHNGKRKFWLLDQKTSNVPTKYHAFISQVNAAIKTLQ